MTATPCGIFGCPLHQGAGEAGEFGFIQPPGQPPRDGHHRGPLERAIGAEAITDLARQAAEHPGSTRDGVSDAAAVFTAAVAGDPVALAVVEQVATTFAEAIAPAVLVALDRVWRHRLAT